MPDLANMVRHSLSEAVIDCFGTTLSLSLIESGDVKQPNPENCLISSIGFTGKLEGNVAVVVLDNCACKIVGKMLGMDFSSMDSDVKDGMGEICNMIAGGLKTRMTAQGYGFDITVPTAIVGKNLEISFPKDVVQYARRYHGEDIIFDVFIDYRVHLEKPAEVNVSSSMKDEALARFKNLVNSNQQKT